MTLQVAIVYAAGIIALGAISVAGIVTKQNEIAYASAGVIFSMLGYGGGRAWNVIEKRSSVPPKPKVTEGSDETR